MARTRISGPHPIIIPATQPQIGHPHPTPHTQRTKGRHQRRGELGPGKLQLRRHRAPRVRVAEEADRRRVVPRQRLADLGGWWCVVVGGERGGDGESQSARCFLHECCVSGGGAEIRSLAPTPTMPPSGPAELGRRVSRRLFPPCPFQPSIIQSTTLVLTALPKVPLPPSWWGRAPSAAPTPWASRTCGAAAAAPPRPRPPPPRPGGGGPAPVCHAEYVEWKAVSQSIVDRSSHQSQCPSHPNPNPNSID